MQEWEMYLDLPNVIFAYEVSIFTRSSYILDFKIETDTKLVHTYDHNAFHYVSFSFNLISTSQQLCETEIISML